MIIFLILPSLISFIINVAMIFLSTPCDILMQGQPLGIVAISAHTRTPSFLQLASFGRI